MENKLNWERKPTPRGFMRISFSDEHEAKCSLQESSQMGEPCVWLGPDGTDPQVFTPRMHLNQEQAKELIGYLQEFVDTGHL